MNDPTFNLLQLERRPFWYTHLADVEAAMAESDRITWARFDASWTADEGGWFAPDETPESDWEEAGLPFPEDVEDYIAWFRTLPGSTDQSPYPDAPPERAARYVL